MSKHHLQENYKYRMYQLDASAPFSFCSSVASARKSVYSVNSRPKLATNLISYGRLKSRNLVNVTASAAHVPEFKTNFKRVVSQEPAKHRKLKLKNSSRIAIKRNKFNIHTIKPKIPSSTKQEKSFGERSVIAAYPPNKRPNIQICPSKNHEYDKLIKFLECTRSKFNKARPITPCSQLSKPGSRKNNFAEIVQNKSIRRKMCKDIPLKQHEGSYEIFDNKTSNNKLLNSVKFSKKEYDDPYKIMQEVKGSKQVQFLSTEDSKRLWKKYVNNDDNCSTATGKLSSLIGRSVPNEEDSDSDDNVTVIENDCDNDYDLIYKCLQNRKL